MKDGEPMKNNFAKLGTYLHFICRRERIMTTIWIISIVGFAGLVAAIYPSLLPTQAETMQMAASMSNPAMVAMMGPIYGMESLTQASVMTQECLIWLMITAAIMNIFLVNRHSRGDEELGRLEMFRALPVGRLTGGFATILFAFLIDVSISLLIGFSLIALNIEGTTVVGALVYGFSIGMVGFVFASLTLLLAQILSTAQGVSGMSFALLGLFYILRAVGDIEGNILSFISPIGLGMKVEAFYSNLILPIVLLIIEGLVILTIALIISAIRDHGTGLVPASKGRAKASRFLCNPFGFAFRLSRSTILGWGLGLFLLGISYGSICPSINDFVDNNEMMQKVLRARGSNVLLDSYVSMIFSMMSMLASVPVVLSAMKIYSEEKRGRLDQVLSRAVPRLKLYCSYIIIAIIESVIMQFLLASGMVLASSGKLDFFVVLKASLNYLPALWVMIGLTVFLVGVLPNLTSLIWLVFGYSFVVVYIGSIIDFPEWMAKVTPFGNLPLLPVEDFALTPLIILTLVAAVLTVVGMWRYKRRDIM